MVLKRIEIIDKEPISIEEAKIFLRIDHNDEDELISTLIQAARLSIESYTSRSLLREKWLFTINSGFALSRSDQEYLSGSISKGINGIEFPRTPFVELVSASLIKKHNKEEIKDFRIDESANIAKIHFQDNSKVKSCLDGVIKLEFIAGYCASELPAPLKQAILSMLAYLYENRPAVNDNFGMLMNNSVLTLIKPYKIYRLG